MNLIDELKQYNTAEISDALDACGVEGALLNIKPVTHCKKMIGPAFTVKYLPYTQKPSEFKNAGDYIDEVPAGAVIVIDNQGRLDCTSWGDILTQVALLKQINGTVIHGSVRDVQFIRETNYPLFATNIYMRSGKNRVYKADQQCEVIIGGVSIKPDDIIFGDENGVIAIPKILLKEVLEKAGNIQKTEDQIITAVKTGTSLEMARKTFRYDQPWLKSSSKV